MTMGASGGEGIAGVETRMRGYLALLYGEGRAPAVLARLLRLAAAHRRDHPARPAAEVTERLTERDALLITYGDSIRRADERPLQTLAAFAREHLGELVNGIHILPFYPWSSDDGFSVIDYRALDPALGTWEDVAALGRSRRLMFDAVINHVSQHSAWFQGFLRGEEPYTGYFIAAEPDWDLSRVARPRTLPLLTPVETARGARQVWTTFSTDQIDLNYANPDVLIEIAALLLFYAAQGASLIRLDAIAYMWKEPGTSCIHLPQTHAIIKLLRALLDLAAPHVLLITETNVPHADNISYFGAPLPGSDRTDEAQLVYQFPLAPLILHTFGVGDASALSAWAAGLGDAPGLFFNFIASHDGIGVMPARGLIAPEEVEALVQRTLAHGGRVSYRNNPDGTQSPYELNVTLYDALNDPEQPDLEQDAARFMAAEAIMLALAGVPGVYVHSLFGSRNCHACFEETGRARSLNRAKLDYGALQAELADPGSRAARVFAAHRLLLARRAAEPAFHPRAPQRVLDLHPAIFALLRTRRDGSGAVLCLTNVGAREQSVTLPAELAGRGLRDLVAGNERTGETVTLRPYQCAWLATEM